MSARVIDLGDARRRRAGAQHWAPAEFRAADVDELIAGLADLPLPLRVAWPWMAELLNDLDGLGVSTVTPRKAIDVMGQRIKPQTFKVGTPRGLEVARDKYVMTRVATVADWRDAVEFVSAQYISRRAPAGYLVCVLHSAREAIGGRLAVVDDRPPDRGPAA